MIDIKYHTLIEDTFSKRKSTKTQEQEGREYVCFSCLTPFHILTSILLAKYVYNNKDDILLISNSRLDAHNIAEKISKSNIFSRIKVIDEKNGNDDYIYTQLSTLKDLQIDVLHFFNWNSKANLLLLSYLQPSTKVVLTDEGTMTYFAFEFAKEYATKNNCPFIEEFLTEQVDEVWLYNPILYCSALNRRVVRIPTLSFLQHDDVETLNYIFDFNPELIKTDFDVFFMDQNLSAAGLMPLDAELHLLKTVLDSLSKYKVLFKKHPGDSNYTHKYNAIKSYANVEVLENSFPFELYLMNLQQKDKLNDKTFITYFSSIGFNIYTFAPEGQCKIFLLHNIISKVAKVDITYVNYLNSMFRKLSTVYKHIYSPESVEEFRKYMDNLNVFNLYL